MLDFHVEVRSAEEWTIPAAYRGEFTWRRPREFYSTRCNAKAFQFWIGLSLFPLKPGLPDPRWSQFSRWIHEHDERHDKVQAWWIDYSDLRIDSWAATSMLVESQVPNWCAPAFGDGESPFPATLRREIDPDELELQIGRAVPVCSPRISGFGEYRDRLSRMSEQANVYVTWRSTYHELWGAQVVAGFQALRLWGADHDLRVICIQV